MQERCNILITEDQVKERVREIAKQINADYAGKTLDIICLMNSALLFTTDLIKHITIPTRLHLLGFNTYPDGNETGEVRITLDVAEPMFNRDVLVIEGIIISGNTPHYILELIRRRRPNTLALCAIGFKPHLLTNELPLNYVGFKLGNEIVIGYGVGSGPTKTLACLCENTNKL